MPEITPSPPLFTRRTLLRGAAGTALAAPLGALGIHASAAPAHTPLPSTTGAAPIDSLLNLDLSTLSDADATAIMAAQRPFRITNEAFFRIRYVGARFPYGPSTGAGKSDADLLSDLTAFLGKRFGTGADGQAKLASVTQLFSDPNTQAIVPSARLRSALLSLTGTYAEPVISAVLHDKHVVFMDFQPIPGTGDTGTIDARTIGERDGARIYFNPNLSNENPFVLAGTVVHEATRLENARVFNALPATQFAWEQDPLVLGTAILTDPAVANEPTLYARYQNAALFLYLNGRRQGDAKVRANGDPLPNFPGTRSESVGTYLSEIVVQDATTPHDATPLGPLCRQLTLNLTGTPAASDDFAAATQDVSDNLTLFTAKQWLQIAQILQLDVSPAA